eukprot:47526-Amphidinium_carterae.1
MSKETPVTAAVCRRTSRSQNAREIDSWMPCALCHKLTGVMIWVTSDCTSERFRNQQDIKAVLQTIVSSDGNSNQIYMVPSSGCKVWLRHQSFLLSPSDSIAK